MIVSLLINSKDRKRADQQARDDRRAALDLAMADRAATREDAQRRHIVDLLLELGRKVGRQAAYAHAPQSADAAQQIMLLLNALPGECANTVRKKFNVIRQMTYPGAVGEKIGHVDLSSITPAGLDPTHMNREIAFDIDRYLTSGRPPDEVWSDSDNLQEWQRRRWPRQ